jgi:hypothetical protein
MLLIFLAFFIYYFLLLKKMFEFMLQFDVRLDIKNNQGLTPLSLAAKLARKEVDFRINLLNYFN